MKEKKMKEKNCWWCICWDCSPIWVLISELPGEKLELSPRRRNWVNCTIGPPLFPVVRCWSLCFNYNLEVLNYRDWFQCSPRIKTHLWSKELARDPRLLSSCQKNLIHVIIFYLLFWILERCSITFQLLQISNYY